MTEGVLKGGSDAALFLYGVIWSYAVIASEAKQSIAITKKDWIASSLSLLAMTARRARAGSPDRAALHARWQRQVAVHRHVPDFLRIFADGAVG